MIEAAIAKSRAKVAGPRGASARLGIPPSTLKSKIKQFKIEQSRFTTASCPHESCKKCRWPSIHSEECANNTRPSIRNHNGGSHVVMRVIFLSSQTIHGREALYGRCASRPLD